MTTALTDRPHPARSTALPRSARLTESAHFARVFEDPIKRADRYFTLLATARPQGGARLGLAIAKKQVRRAVDRNRLKRLIREAFRKEHCWLGDIDVVVMARRAALVADNRLLRQSLDDLFERIARDLRR